MAREIKFRFWNHASKSFCFDRLIDSDGDIFKQSPAFDDYYCELNECDEVTACQYTGINEYNRETNKYDGEEIYQGFIVKRIFNEFHKDDFVGVVKELEGCWVIDNGKDSIKLWTECEENKILGNVFENPELI